MATTRIMPLHIGKGRTESRAISCDYRLCGQSAKDRPRQAHHPATSATAVWPTPSLCWPSASISPPPDGFVERTM